MSGHQSVNFSPDSSIAQSLSEALLLAVDGLDHGQREQAIAQAAQAADPEGLVHLIAVDSAARRNAALEALGKAGRRSVPALVRALGDPDPEVVMFAASTLGKTLDQSAVPHLARLLNHPDINVCQAAIESLGALRATSTLTALDGLLGRDVWLRFSVVHTLGEIGDPRSARTLMQLLGDEQVREGALSALGKVGGLEVVEELVRRLEGTASPRDFALFVRALGNALAQLPDNSVLRDLTFWAAFSGRADTTVAPRLIDLLRAPPDSGDSGEGVLTVVEAAIELVRCLRLRSCFPAVIAASADERYIEDLLFAAADIGAPLIPYLTAALSHRDRNVRRYACRALASVAAEGAAPTLLALLADADETVRATVARVLSRLHHTDGIALIVERLDDPSTLVRTAVVEALGRMDAHLVSKAMLRNPQRLAERFDTVLAIMQANPHPLQRGFLEGCLRDARVEIRTAAVASLAAQRGTDLVGVLEPLLADPSVAVRRAALDALTDHPTERIRQVFLRLLERDPEMRRDVIRALGRIGDDRVIPRVVEIFAACDATQKAYAVDALGAIESASVEPFIAQQLGHRDPRVRRHAVRALVRLGTSSALRRVGAALRDADPQVRLTVAKAMSSCPHPIARSALERLCLDPVENVAASARALLGR
jgi:HEAT repeat protein